MGSRGALATILACWAVGLLCVCMSVPGVGGEGLPDLGPFWRGRASRFASNVVRARDLARKTVFVPVVKDEQPNNDNGGNDNNNDNNNNDNNNDNNDNDNNNDNNDNNAGGVGINDQCKEDGPRYPICAVCHDDGSFEVSVLAPQDNPVKWEGWGTSLAWSARFLASQGADFRDNVLDLLFDKNKGLGLNIVRYAIPASFNPVTQKRPPMFGKFIAQGFVAATPRDKQDVATWRFDWTQDRAQRGILDMAKRRGVSKVEAISYSPPHWLTYTGDVTGAKSPCGPGCKAIMPNIPPENFQSFAKYLAQVVKQFKDNWDTEFATVTAFNEPLEGWWFQGGFHEGCSMGANGIVQMSNKLREELDNLELGNVGVTMADSWADNSVGLLSQNWKEFPNSVSRISIHGYRQPEKSNMVSDWNLFRTIWKHAQKQGKPVYQTEWGPMGASEKFKNFFDIDAGLLLGRSIAQHINLMGAQAWYYWLAFEPCVGTCGWWGLVQTGDANNGDSPRLTKQYHVMKHFVKNVPEGSTILPIDGGCQHGVVAAFDADKRQVSVTIVNQRGQGATANVCLKGFRTDDDASGCALLRTTRDDNYVQGDCNVLDGVANGADVPCFTATLDETSIATYTLSPVVPK